MDIIDIWIYQLIIAAISLLFIYTAAFINLNIISGIAVSSFSFATVLFLKSYLLFCASIIVMLIICCKYYNKKRKKIGDSDLLSSFILNLVNIAFSVYTLVQITYYNPVKFSLQLYIPFTKIYLIEVIPIIYMTAIYSLEVLLILSINNNLSLRIKKYMHFTVVKTTSAIISVVLSIIVINAVLYFIVHNFPVSESMNLFDGNFLKDAIRANYRLPKAFPDCLWFSATTFFTVGYGDMHPVGNIMYMLSIMEMISAYILGIIMVPIVLLKLPNY